MLDTCCTTASHIGITHISSVRLQQHCVTAAAHGLLHSARRLGTTHALIGCSHISQYLAALRANTELHWRPQACPGFTLWMKTQTLGSSGDHSIYGWRGRMETQTLGCLWGPLYVWLEGPNSDSNPGMPLGTTLCMAGGAKASGSIGVLARLLTPAKQT